MEFGNRSLHIFDVPDIAYRLIASGMKNLDQYCFLDLDLDGSRKKLSTCAAFVDSTDLTYGFSSKNLLALGGSELSRLQEIISTDHQWASKDTECGGIITQPPPEGRE